MKHYDHYLTALCAVANELAAFDKAATIVKDLDGQPVVISPLVKTVFYITTGKSGNSRFVETITWGNGKKRDIYIKALKAKLCAETVDVGFSLYVPNPIDKEIKIELTREITHDAKTMIHKKCTAKTKSGGYTAWFSDGIVIAKSVIYQTAGTIGPEIDLK